MGQLQRRVVVHGASTSADRPIVGEADALLLFVVEGSDGAASLEVSTGWFLPNALVGIEVIDRSDFPEAGVGYHSPSPRGTSFDEHKGCPLYGTCWGGGSTVAGRHVLRELLLHGDAVVWDELESFYRSTFELGQGPQHLEELKRKGRTVRYAP